MRLKEADLQLQHFISNLVQTQPGTMFAFSNIQNLPGSILNPSITDIHLLPLSVQLSRWIIENIIRKPATLCIIDPDQIHAAQIPALDVWSIDSIHIFFDSLLTIFSFISDNILLKSHRLLSIIASQLYNHSLSDCIIKEIMSKLIPFQAALLADYQTVTAHAISFETSLSELGIQTTINCQDSFLKRHYQHFVQI